MSNPDLILAELKQDINKAIECLDAGKLVDMNSIDEKTKTFCKSIKTLDAVKAFEYEPKLLELINHINIITQRLGENKDKIENELSTNISRKKAHNAYGNTAKTIIQKQDNKG